MGKRRIPAYHVDYTTDCKYSFENTSEYIPGYIIVDVVGYLYRQECGNRWKVETNIATTI